MPENYKYSLLQFRSQAVRDERLNVGIAVFFEESIKFHLAQNFGKLRSISAALDADQVREAILNIEKLYPLLIAGQNQNVDLLRNHLNAIAPVQFSKFGNFSAPTKEIYSLCVAEIMRNLVEPEPAVARMPKKKNSGLLNEMSAIFKARKILAGPQDDIDSHRILKRFDVAEGLRADLLLKNGKMHVVETVDATADDVSIKRVVTDIAVSALVFEQARMRWPHQTTSRLVYSASFSMERAATPSLLAAEHQGAELINWKSANDRDAFISNITSLAEPSNADASQGKLAINASTAPKQSLN